MKRFIAEIVLALLGLVLIIDSLFLHLITFNYSMIGLGFLDPYIQHWMIGFVLVILAVYDFRISRK